MKWSCSWRDRGTGRTRNTGLLPRGHAIEELALRQVPFRCSRARLRGVRRPSPRARGPLHPEAGRGDHAAAVRLRGQGREKGRPEARDDAFPGSYGHGQGRSPANPDQVVLDPPVLEVREDAARQGQGALPVER